MSSRPAEGSRRADKVFSGLPCSRASLIRLTARTSGKERSRWAESPDCPKWAIFPQPWTPLTIGLFLDLVVDLAHGGLQVVPAQGGPIHSTYLSQLHQSIKVTGSRVRENDMSSVCIVSQKSRDILNRYTHLASRTLRSLGSLPTS